MRLSKRQLKRIIREEKRRLTEWTHARGGDERDPDPMAEYNAESAAGGLEDDIASIIMIDVLGYEPEDSDEMDRVYEAAQKIIDLCTR